MQRTGSAVVVVNRKNGDSRDGCGRPGCTRCGRPRQKAAATDDDSTSSSTDDNEDLVGKTYRAAVHHHHLARQQATYRALEAAEARLKEHGLERVRIDADGNCMFRAIAAFFRHPSITHTTVRRLIVDYIASHAEQFRVDVECDWPTLEQYCREMRKARTWGDATALSAFCMAQNVNIVVFGEHGYSELYPGEGRVKLALLHVDGHYDATRVIVG